MKLFSCRLSVTPIRTKPFYNTLIYWHSAKFTFNLYKYEFYRIFVFIPTLKLRRLIYVNLQANSRLTGKEEYPILNPVSSKGFVNTVNAMGIIAADFSDIFFHAALKNIFKLRF